MEITLVDIKKLKPYENNPRLSGESVEKIASSIKQFGWQQPIVTDKEYTIIVGHGRYEAAKKLNISKVPIHIASELTDTQVKACRLIDNHTNTYSQFDLLKLEAEIKQLLSLDFDLSGFEDLLLQIGKIDIKKIKVTPIPKIAWVLIGCPFDEYIDIAKEVESISQKPGIIFESTYGH